MLRGYIIVCVTVELQTRCTRYPECCTNNPEIFYSRAKLTPQNTPFYLATSSQICLVSSQCACWLYKVFLWERDLKVLLANSLIWVRPRLLGAQMNPEP